MNRLRSHLKHSQCMLYIIENTRLHFALHIQGVPKKKDTLLNQAVVSHVQKCVLNVTAEDFYGYVAN